MKPANFTIFLDRDGVINVDSPDYIKCAEEFHFIAGSAEAIALLSKRGFDVVVITNQSGVGRGMFTCQELESIFYKMTKEVADEGGLIKDIFFCPHTPEDGCLCRKPLPGLILQAIEQYGIDPARSCMVGDSIRDIECARNAGCRYSLLVRTGNGRAAEAMLKNHSSRKNRGETDLISPKPDFIADNLMEAVRWLESVRL